MKFYRTLTPFKVISFDLDDTLYDNSSVIELAEQYFLAFIKTQSQITALDEAYWKSWKMKIYQQNPLLCEDVIAWRRATLSQLLAYHHKTESDIQKLCDAAMQYFTEWRHRIDIPAQSVAVLNELKTRYTLVAITNGNVSPSRIGLDQFAFTLRGGEQGRAKPHADLFHQTAQYFHIQPQEILHVGDNLTTDVQGAIQAGCQAAWINLSGRGIRTFSECRVLPTLEINALTQLCHIM